MTINPDGIEGNSGAIELALKPYYVYALLDPRNNEVFYVGKGQNGRMGAHELAVQKNERAEDTAKNARIREIHAAGCVVKGRVIARFDSESEAFAVEAVLIHWTYGRRVQEGGSLTNIQAGHGHRHVRCRGDTEERPSLDVPTRIASYNGEYSRKALARLERNGVPDIALDVVDRVHEGLMRRRIALSFGAPSIIESGRYIATDASLDETVVMRLQFTPWRLVTNLRAADEGTPQGRAVFRRTMADLGLQPKNGRYAWVDDWKNNGLCFDDTEAILDRIEAAHTLFRPAQTQSLMPDSR